MQKVHPGICQAGSSIFLNMLILRRAIDNDNLLQKIRVESFGLEQCGQRFGTISSADQNK
jgi:hypothetical protein